MSLNNICFIDFETTGIDVFRDAPLEFGAVLVNDNFDEIKKFHSKIKVEKKVHLKKSALSIHNITIDSLSNSPTQKELLNDFFESFGTDYRFAGWNINFDVTFFRKMCNLNGKMVLYNKINHRHLDVQSINYLANQLKLYPSEINSLSQLADHFNINRDVTHSAIEDAIITMQVYKKLINLFKMEFKQSNLHLK